MKYFIDQNSLAEYTYVKRQIFQNTLLSNLKKTNYCPKGHEFSSLETTAMRIFDEWMLTVECGATYKLRKVGQSPPAFNGPGILYRYNQLCTQTSQKSLITLEIGRSVCVAKTVL